MSKLEYILIGILALILAISVDHFHKTNQKFGVTCFDHNITIEAYKYEYGAGGCAKFYSTKTIYQPSVLICGCNVIVPEEKK